MFNSIRNLFTENSKQPREMLRNDYRVAMNCFERAMRNHGINSDEANHWAAKADQAELALAS